MLGNSYFFGSKNLTLSTKKCIFFDKNYEYDRKFDLNLAFTFYWLVSYVFEFTLNINLQYYYNIIIIIIFKKKNLHSVFS